MTTQDPVAEARRDLDARIGAELAKPIFPAAIAAAEALRAHFGPPVSAILFYGSCLRDGDDEGKILDFYVVVDRYRDVFGAGWKTLANAVLPPNVFYFETTFDGRVVRSKVAVFSLADFEQATSSRHFDSYVWARYAQPSALAYVRDDAIRRRIEAAVAQCSATLLEKTVPLFSGPFRASDLWSRGFTQTYRVELRSEGPGKGAEIYALGAERYDALTESALKLTKWPVIQGADGRYAGPSGAGIRLRAAAAWRLRRVYCSTLNILRLTKAVFTFSGGIDYIAWKIARHSGVQVEITPWQRRHPLLAGVTLFWRLRRKGAFR
ncbi:MAG TPA: hypothetical protein VKA19_15190 [Alphaproteobacteria bacterium]|nr:hypothetical protein [Alphaproteobacteria bacterium]